MKRTAKEIKNQTGISTETVEILADELDRIQDLKILFKSDGGKAMLDRLVSNCASALNKMYSAENPTLDFLLAHLAKYKANIDLLAEFQDIAAEEEISNQLEQAVKEAGQHIT
jgi:uncharacterized protein YerC